MRQRVDKKPRFIVLESSRKRQDGAVHFSVHSPVLYAYRVKSSSQKVYASMRKMRKSRKTSLMEFTPFVAA